MSGSIKKISFWIKRRSGLPVILVGGIIVVMLLFNDETSISLNLKYQKQITALKQEIKLNRDSAQYYKMKRESILTGGYDLERIAREQYHMQRSSEDVFLLK